MKVLPRSCWLFILWILAFSSTGESSQGVVRVYPLIVKVHFEIDEILFLDDDSQRMGLRITLATQWKDPYRTHVHTSDKNVPSKNEFDPELFMDAQDESVLLHRSTQVTSEGKRRQSQRLISTFTCRMRFNWLPVDVQICSITLRSAIYDKHVIFLSWEDDPIVLPANGNNANFTPIAVESSLDGDCLKSADATDFSCLRVKIVFQRNYHRYLIAYIIPTGLLALVAWLTLFIRCSSIRALIIVVCMFTITTLMYATYMNLACPWCLKLLDAWTLTCGGIVFFCLLEFLVVQLTFKRQVSGRKKYTINDIKPNCVDAVFRVAIGVLLSFMTMFFLVFIYVTAHERNGRL